MEVFRQMLNDCIRIGLRENRTSLQSIQRVAYPELKKYRVVSAYRNNAMSRACGILSNYKKLLKKGGHPRTPYCKRLMLTTCTGFVLKLEGNELVLPGKIRVKLNDYLLKKLQGKELRSVTITNHGVSVSYANPRPETVLAECNGIMGADFNYQNITTADTTSDILRNVHQYPLDQMLQYKLQCRQTKSRFIRNDVRIRKAVYSKYGKLEADKTLTETHKLTSRLSKTAKKHHLGVAVEEGVKDIRKLGYKGNWQGRNFRFKLNSWSRGEAKRQLEYKCKREGVPFLTVSARGTSSRCAICGDRLIAEEHRTMYCPTCKMHIDRDDNASVSIMKRGLQKLFWTWFRPVGLSSEAVKGNPTTTEVILGADVSQLNVVVDIRQQSRTNQCELIRPYWEQ